MSDREIRAALMGKQAERIAERISDAAHDLRVAITEEKPLEAMRALLTVLHGSEELAILTKTRVVLRSGS